jgi:hypothetical protein
LNSGGVGPARGVVAFATCSQHLTRNSESYSFEVRCIAWRLVLCQELARGNLYHDRQSTGSGSGGAAHTAGELTNHSLRVACRWQTGGLRHRVAHLVLLIATACRGEHIIMQLRSLVQERLNISVQRLPIWRRPVLYVMATQWATQDRRYWLRVPYHVGSLPSVAHIQRAVFREATRTQGSRLRRRFLVRLGDISTLRHR